MLKPNVVMDKITVNSWVAVRMALRRDGHTLPTPLTTCARTTSLVVFLSDHHLHHLLPPSDYHAQCDASATYPTGRMASYHQVLAPATPKLL
jgi:hypothetical protein